MSKARIYSGPTSVGWDSAFWVFNSLLNSGGNRFVGRPKQRRLAPARRHFLQRNPVDESSLAKGSVRKRARERRRSRRDHLRHAYSGALDLSHNLQQVVVAVMRHLGPFRLFQSAILAVVVVQTAELQAVGAN